MNYTTLRSAIKRANRVECTIDLGVGAYFNAKLTKREVIIALKNYLDNEDIAGCGIWYNENDEIICQAFSKGKILSIGI